MANIYPNNQVVPNRSVQELDTLTQQVNEAPPAPPQVPKSKRSRLFTIASILVIIIAIATVVFNEYQKRNMDSSTVSSYEECANLKGSVIQESYPETCITSDGQRFVHKLSADEQQRLVTTTPDPTIDWKTYINSQMEFSFKYPPSWYSYLDQANLISLTTTDPNLGGNFQGFSVERHPNSEELSLKEFWRNQFEVYNEYVRNIEKNYLEETSIDNHEALRENPDAAPERQMLTKIFVTKPPYVYELRGVTLEGNLQEIEIFNQILSTFKFTDEQGEVKNVDGEFCGGFAGISCPQEYNCILDGSYPDAGGVCIEN